MKQDHHHQQQQQQQQQQGTKQRNLIVGGHNIVQGRYPYFVSIDKNNGVIVNGALIAPDIVLSAGHIGLNHMDNLTIKVGPYAVHEKEEFAEEIKEVEWLVPKSWNESTPAVFHNDYMILKLAESSTHKPVKINRDPTIPFRGERVVMAGLGWLTESQMSPASIVQEVELVAVDNEECRSTTDPSRNKSYEGVIDESMLCTKAPPNTVRDGCAWDSGAPVIIAGATPGEDVLVGLGSSGVGCADPVFPAIQARVGTEFSLDWIRQQVCRLSVDPPDEFHCGTIDATSTSTTVSASLVPANSLTAINTDEAGSAPALFIAGCLVAVLVAMFVVKRAKTTIHQQAPLSAQTEIRPVVYGAIDP